MPVSEAWAALGEDARSVLDELRSRPDVPSRILAAQEALARAEKVAKALMVAHHPDKNPGDPGAAARFRRVKEALDSIRFHTQEFVRKGSGHGSAPPTIVFK